ncbi:MAG TPA: sugar phosphate nucleotidyltransferase [Steroidobacteraceae bacterium]|nr:sugar phosphate nucleotidyltransferase [Steroidobacteraceae bacterium]
MKVVLFCGGLGTRLREHSETVPKPLVSIGFRPILWHLMRYYAHYGHKDFILCLGYRGDLIRDYFLRYDECMTNDFTMHGAGGKVELHHVDASDWNITFVDTGLHSNIGQRLLRARRYLEGESEFLANYADGLSDLPLDALIDDFRRKQVVASFASVRSWHSFHAVEADAQGIVTAMGPMRSDQFMINGGFFALRSDVFDYINEGEELVEQPFTRLREKRLLATYRYNGFWQPMDTFKDKINFDRMDGKGECPWKVWQR